MSSGSSIVGEKMGVTKAEVGNKDEAAGSFAGEIDVTKADLVGNKEAAGTNMMVTEASWIDHVFLTKPLAGSVPKATEPTGAMITKEMVPDSFMDRLTNRRRPFKKLPPLNDFSGVYAKFPEVREAYVSNMTQWKDVLRQHAAKGFAEVGVDFSHGIKKIFILPQSAEGHY